MVAVTGKHRTVLRPPLRVSRDCLTIAIVAFCVLPCLVMLNKQTPVVYEGLADIKLPTTIVPLHHDVPHPRFRFLQQQSQLSLESDVAELRHCNLQHIDWEDYFAWASRILDEKMPQFQSNQDYLNFTDWQDMEQEFVLELLEIYSSFHEYCRFDTGYPFLPSAIPKEVSKMFPNVTYIHKKHARLAIGIIAFHDAPQLQRLVEAIHMPHHLILIHLERRTPPDFAQQVHAIASRYPNVAVVQFGTIIYRTELVTSIQLQLIKWFSSSSLTFDYYIALNGAAFPLYSAEELARHLRNSSRNVWLGEMTHGPDGIRVRSSEVHLLAGAKRLSYTRGSTIKGTFRLPQSLVHQNGMLEMSVSHSIKEAMSRKTVSGNQAVYSYETVQKLMASPEAMELFAYAKYGCCNVLEERTWIAAMRLIGLGEEALEEAGCMWQAWGGTRGCKGTVNNAVLTRNESQCFVVEDGTRGIERNNSVLKLHGHEIMAYLKDAKNRGFLFARKFQSSNEDSVSLLEDIRAELHDS